MHFGRLESSGWFRNWRVEGLVRDVLLLIEMDLLADDVWGRIGVFMMASASQIWRATGGRFNSSFFQYKIGGEW
jgi:hypothetical protein